MYTVSVRKLLNCEPLRRPTSVPICCLKSIIRMDSGRGCSMARPVININDTGNKRGMVISAQSQQQLTMAKKESRCPFANGNHPGQSAKLSLSVNDKPNVLVDESSSAQATTGLPFEQIPTPKGLPFVGTLFDLIKAGGAQFIHQYCDKRHEILGGMYREKLGDVEAVFIADDKLIQQVYEHEGKYPQHMVPEPWIIYNQERRIRRGLFFMDGEEWSVHRSALNKVFLKPAVIKEYSETFNQVVTDILDKWSEKMQSQSPSSERSRDTILIDDLEKELYDWSIESLGTMIFGRRLGCIAKQQSLALPDIHEFVDGVQQIFIESANMQLIPPKLAHYFKLPVWKRFEKAAGKTLDLALQYVNEYAKQVDDRGHDHSILRQLMQDGHIDTDEIGRIIVDLFIAAADTTSHATQWALYLLSRHEDVQERLYQEVQQVTNGQPVSEQHLPDLAYVKGIIKESLRLYPVAPFLTRYLPEDLILGGYQIPKGQLMVISLYTTGRKGQYFDEPEKFKPTRWLRDKNQKNQIKNPYACLPFGMGVRSCIGRRVAEIQMQFFLTRIVQNYKIQPTSDEEIDIRLRMITTPEKPINLILKKRAK